MTISIKRRDRRYNCCSHLREGRNLGYHSLAIRVPRADHDTTKGLESPENRFNMRDCETIGKSGPELPYMLVSESIGVNADKSPDVKDLVTMRRCPYESRRLTRIQIIATISIYEN